MAGVTIRVKTVAKVNPITIDEDNLTQNVATGPPTSICLDIKSTEIPEAIGSRPKPVVNVVKNTGRKR